MKIFITQYNTDMTEGRGHMANDKAFTKREYAAAYIDDKPGCMGRRCKWSEEKYGDWGIVEIEVLDHAFSPIDAAEELRKSALAKLRRTLTAAEIKALGLK